MPPPREEWGLIKTLPPRGAVLPLPLRGTPTGSVRTAPRGGAAPPPTGSACLPAPSTALSPSISNTKTPSALTSPCCCVGYWLPGSTESCLFPEMESDARFYLSEGRSTGPVEEKR